MRRLVLAVLLFYQKFLSPLKPPSCRFYPTCSDYAVQAVLRYGAFRGMLMAAWRLLRCQPFCRGGYDPVK